MVFPSDEKGEFFPKTSLLEGKRAPTKPYSGIGTCLKQVLSVAITHLEIMLEDKRDNDVVVESTVPTSHS